MICQFVRHKRGFVVKFLFSYMNSVCYQTANLKHLIPRHPLSLYDVLESKHLFKILPLVCYEGSFGDRENHCQEDSWEKSAWRETRETRVIRGIGLFVLSSFLSLVDHLPL
jgi:hypothetical protein